MIGIFDSGVGGLSVMAAVHRQLPQAMLAYVADSAHAPYGERDAAHVQDRSMRLTAHLLEQGAQLIVVACNTATALAIDQLRARWPDVPFVGVEPGIKPACEHSRNRRVGVLATPATLQSERVQTLIERHAAGCTVTAVPCAGLAAAIEQGHAGDADIDALLDRYCAVLRDADVDTVVLGCTHYPLVAGRITTRLPAGTDVIDTAVAVARRTAQLYSAPAAAQAPLPSIHLQSTGDSALLQRLAHEWLGIAAQAESLSC